MLLSEKNFKRVPKCYAYSTYINVVNNYYAYLLIFVII